MSKVLASSFLCDAGLFHNWILPELFTNEVPNQNPFSYNKARLLNFGNFKIFINVWITVLVKPLNKDLNKTMVLISF